MSKGCGYLREPAMVGEIWNQVNHLFICVGEGTAKCSLEKTWTLEFGKPDLKSLIPDL